MMEYFISFDNVYYSYDFNDEEDSTYYENYAVSGINFSVKEGEFLAIIGRNGSGKSTIAKLANALIFPSEGVVTVLDIDTTNEEYLYEIRQNVGMVFQNPDNQIIGTSVEEDIAFGPENLGVPREEMIKRIEFALKYTGLTELRHNEPHYLSGGQKQRVAIAGILAMKPRCIVLDEATAMLDPIGRKEVMSLIKRLNEEDKITIIHITHHMDEVTNADRVLLIDNGRIIMEGTPKEIFIRSEELKEAGLEQPQITTLVNELADEGIDLPRDIITVDEALEHIKPLIAR
ncbi:MAG TPA: energy-coupling factor transporter ATPase [Clostridiaceae bacterium]|nr:energy-coupling factor transporter ATPase [Clostridiaceae bacterium]